MLRSPDGRHHAKVVGPDGVDRLAGERDRQTWLAAVGVVGPVTVDWATSDDGAHLVSTTVPGIPASDLVDGADVARAMVGVGELLAQLHAVTVPCPFDRSLRVTLPLARRAVDTGAIDLDDLDDERVGRSGASLLAELEGLATSAPEDLVLCHGDASLPNLLLDPETLRPTGVVDVGALGTADRHLDLALVARSMSDDRNPGFRASAPDACWVAYGRTPDPARVSLYQLLDEFF